MEASSANKKTVWFVLKKCNVLFFYTDWQFSIPNPYGKSPAPAKLERTQAKRNLCTDTHAEAGMQQARLLSQADLSQRQGHAWVPTETG